MLTVDDLLRAKESIERGATAPRICGVRVHAGDLADLQHRQVPESLISYFLASFIGVPVMTDVRLRRGEYRVATSPAEWRAWQEEGR